ncbi:MAG TPA: tRNA (adenosine(37)-N6)-threonylcarbamoyltransferase complex ATPase subunit type 1 TsaE [Acidimicrobiales bacterium]|nr:tRNA (adenosine(37)-N6)-threonylcarbamoyltransferase complex ATPase subunit type 1 TsaE [Acidimicrobiales bacterium]
MIGLRTKSADDTREVASRIGMLAAAGDVLLLGGDLGAGKTTFTQGLARGLGIDEQVTSPTFVIMHTYAGRVRLHHVDLYRMDSLHDVHELGLPEMFDGDAVSVIEWGELATPAIAADFLEVRIELAELDDPDDERLMRLRPVGPSWAGRMGRLEASVGRWTA